MVGKLLFLCRKGANRLIREYELSLMRRHGRKSILEGTAFLYVVGNPGKVIKKRFTDEEIIEHERMLKIEG